MHNVAPENNGQLETEQPVYHQPAPGLDYTMQNRRETQPYNPHLMSHIAVPPQTSSQAPNSIQQRPNSAQNTVQYHYEPTPSPIQ